MKPLQEAKLKALKVGWEGLTTEEKKLLLGNKRWRMNNLYFIRDKDGQKVIFKMNTMQLWLFNNLWYLNIVLKARQMGSTTFIDLYILDECIFNSGVEAGIIAHNKDDVKKIFRRKIQFPYKNLPQEIRDAVWPISDSQTSLELSNGSVVSVGTSYRSGTCQYLHISEHGKICAKFPDKAEEIKTGALPAVATTQKDDTKGGTIVFIESTAEGRGGDFHDFCQTAKKLKEEDVELTTMDYKFHFFPWFDDPSYKLDDYQLVVIINKQAQYFEDLERLHSIKLTSAQKAWYVKKEAEQGDKMKREYPSTAEESFEAAIKGAYWSDEMQFLRNKRRIRNVPHEPSLQVHTGWDLGRRDTNPIWFFQVYGNQFRFIDYYVNSKKSAAHYARVIREKGAELGYNYGNHYMPHDVEVTDYTQENNLSRLQVFRNLGLRNIIIVHRETDLRHMEGINSVRQLLPLCWFDKKLCEPGIAGLEAYQPKWDNKLAEPGDTPLHNWACLPKGTMINTLFGSKAVEEFSCGDRIEIGRLAPRVTRAQSVGKQEIVLIRLPNRVIVRCSVGHKIFTTEGLIEARNIKPGMVLLTDEGVERWSASSRGILSAFIEHFEVSSTDSGRSVDCMPARSGASSVSCTGSCGSIVTAKFQKRMLLSLSKMIGMTFQKIIGYAGHTPRMVESLRPSMWGRSSAASLFGRYPRQGTTGRSLPEQLSICTGMYGSKVTGLFLKGLSFTISITTSLITWLRTWPWSDSQDIPTTTPLSVISVERQPPETVYDIEVEHHHCYVLSGSGVVTSNSHPSSAMIQIARGYQQQMDYNEEDVLPEEEGDF